MVSNVYPSGCGCGQLYPSGCKHETQAIVSHTQAVVVKRSVLSFLWASSTFVLGNSYWRTVVHAISRELPIQTRAMVDLEGAFRVMPPKIQSGLIPPHKKVPSLWIVYSFGWFLRSSVLPQSQTWPKKAIWAFLRFKFQGFHQNLKMSPELDVYTSWIVLKLTFMDLKN